MSVLALWTLNDVIKDICIKIIIKKILSQSLQNKKDACINTGGGGWYYSISTSLYCTLRLTVRVCPHVAWYKIIKYWLLHCVTGVITGRRAPMGVALGCYWVLADNNLVSWKSSKKYIETWGGSDLYYSILHPLSTNHGVSPKQSIACGTGEGGGQDFQAIAL